MSMAIEGGQPTAYTHLGVARGGSPAFDDTSRLSCDKRSPDQVGLRIVTP